MTARGAGQPLPAEYLRTCSKIKSFYAHQLAQAEAAAAAEEKEEVEGGDAQRQPVSPPPPPPRRFILPDRPPRTELVEFASDETRASTNRGSASGTTRSASKAGTPISRFRVDGSVAEKPFDMQSAYEEFLNNIKARASAEPFK